MQHIDQKPLQDFGLYLRTGRHPAHNKIIDMALADGWIEANPFYAVKYGVERFSERRFRPKRGNIRYGSGYCGGLRSRAAPQPAERSVLRVIRRRMLRNGDRRFAGHIRRPSSGLLCGKQRCHKHQYGILRGGDVRCRRRLPASMSGSGSVGKGTGAKRTAHKKAVRQRCLIATSCRTACHPNSIGLGKITTTSHRGISGWRSRPRHRSRDRSRRG